MQKFADTRQNERLEAEDNSRARELALGDSCERRLLQHGLQALCPK